MKLMVAIPTLDYIHFEFARCLTGLVQKLERDGVDYEVCFKGGTLVYNGRDALAADAINEGYTHILWLDADMVFNPNIFEKLSANNCDFVTGVYHSRHAPYGSCIFTKLPEKAKEYPNHPFEVEGCGFGCVLTSTEMLRAVYRKHGYCFQPTPQYGEDLSFCERARALGYKLICDPSVIAGHIGHVTVWPEGGRDND